jgi:hypothetical protein
MWKQVPKAIGKGFPIPKKEFIINFFPKTKNHQKPKVSGGQREFINFLFYRTNPRFSPQKRLGSPQ